MKSNYDFTIVTPTFNSAEFIEGAILSVLQQRHVAIEYVVQDGGQDHETERIIERVRSSEAMASFLRQGSTFVYRRELDSGQTNAINRGFKNTNAKYMCWLNADDVYYPGVLLRLKEFLDRNPEVSACYGDIMYLNRDGTVRKIRKGLKFNRWILLNTWCFIPQPATVWRRSMWQTFGSLDEGLRLCMDYEYWLRCSKGCRFQYVEIVVAGYRIMPTSKTGASPVVAMPETLRVARVYGAQYLSPMRLAYWAMRLGLLGLVKWMGRLAFARR